MTNLSEERARIVQISQHPSAKLFPKLTDALCDTSYSAEICCSWLEAAAKDRAAAMEAAGLAPRLPSIKRESSGLGSPGSTEDRPHDQNAARAWSKAVAHANRGIVPGAVGGRPNVQGWDKAVQNSNRVTEKF